MLSRCVQAAEKRRGTRLATSRDDKEIVIMHLTFSYALANSASGRHAAAVARAIEAAARPADARDVRPRGYIVAMRRCSGALSRR